MEQNAENVRKHVRVYFIIFGSLLFLTIVTVAISSLHLSVGPAIAVALAVASIKAFLVAGYFMHLLSERKVIYATLALTALFFVVLMILPVSHFLDPIRILH
jgi:cytochrome c oxidase subunit IV